MQCSLFSVFVLYSWEFEGVQSNVCKEMPVSRCAVMSCTGDTRKRPSTKARLHCWHFLQDIKRFPSLAWGKKTKKNQKHPIKKHIVIKCIQKTEAGKTPNPFSLKLKEVLLKFLTQRKTWRTFKYAIHSTHQMPSLSLVGWTIAKEPFPNLRIILASRIKDLQLIQNDATRAQTRFSARNHILPSLNSFICYL